MAATDVERGNIEAIEGGFKAFDAGDMAKLAQLFAEDTVWHGEATGQLAGEYRGRDATFSMFAQLQQLTGGTFRSVPLAMAGSGDKVFVLTEAKGEREGRSLSTRQVLLFTLSGGRVREVELFNANYSASREFWA
jgi:uncharacterized protein